MLGWRLIISAILIPLLIAVFMADHRVGEPAWPLLGLVLLLAFRAVWELVQLIGARFSSSLAAIPLMVVAGGLILSGWMPHLFPALSGSGLDWILGGYTAAVLLLAGWSCLRYRSPDGNVERLAGEMFVVTYVGLLLAVTSQLRWAAGVETGYLALGSLLICTKGGDIGAYFTGRQFGRTKMAPLLSPGKTWEGALGAVLGAGICGVLWFQLAPGWLLPGGKQGPWLAHLAYGAALGITGAAGDLFESLIKRDVGSKDSAALLPGFGGLLDLLDSVLFAGPAAVLLWHVLPLLRR